MRQIDWNTLDAAARDVALQRPASQRSAELRRSVARILEQVRADGDSTLRALTRKFDGVELGELRVSAAEFAAATAAISAEARAAIAAARGVVIALLKRPQPPATPAVV